MNYIVGDIQGCLSGLKQALKKAKFNPDSDKLWAVGDLVARGPDSLKTLKYLKSLGDAFDCVLGNHDLHLIAIYFGAGKLKANDRLDKLVNSDEFESYVTWLLSKPLAIRVDKQHFISHAGLLPHWSVKQAIAYSDEVSVVLKSKKAHLFFEHMYGNEPNIWHEDLAGYDRLRFIVNAFTRMRFLDGKALEFKHKCHPDMAPKRLDPWYKCQNTQLKKKHKIIFGHWASLLGQTNHPQFIGLDTGYVWGKTLSLYCTETAEIISVHA